MKAFKLFCGVLLLPAIALAQDKVDLNTITKVEVKGGSVEITGNKKPNFTTFTMTDPPRLVIDISEAVFSGVPEEIQVGNGTVTAIKTASYGSEAAAIARVLVGFDKDVETDIQTVGDSKLVVKVLGGGAPAVAEKEPPVKAEPPKDAAKKVEADKATQEKSAKEAAALAEKERKEQEKSAKEATAQAEKERKEQEKSAKEATAQAEKERKEQEKSAKESEALAERERLAKLKADNLAAQSAAREKSAASAQGNAEAEAAKRAAAEEKQVAAQKAKEEADQNKRAAAEEKQVVAQKAKEEADQNKRASAEEKKAAAQKAKAAAEESRRAAAEDKQRQAEEKKLAAQKAKEEATEAKKAKRVASAEPASTPSPAREGGGLSSSSKRKTMTLVGFKQEAAASRVFVRTNEPVRYTVSEGADHTVVLELENTKINMRNNERSLDTSYFDTAVAMVSPDEGPTRTVRIKIKLKENVPYEAKQDGNEVSLEFKRPARH